MSTQGRRGADDRLAIRTFIAAYVECALADENYDKLQEIGRRAAASLAEMVAALECDYDRLEELREARRGFDEAGQPKDAESEYENWGAHPDAEELAELNNVAGECESREDAEQRIQEDPLSVEVRGDWHSAGDQESLNAPVEFRILLGTGGPAVRIVGDLDANCEPARARIEAQDWFQPWTEYRGDAISEEDLLTYCRCFYFGEG